MLTRAALPAGTADIPPTLSGGSLLLLVLVLGFFGLQARANGGQLRAQCLPDITAP